MAAVEAALEEVQIPPGAVASARPRVVVGQVSRMGLCVGGGPRGFGGAVWLGGPTRASYPGGRRLRVGSAARSASWAVDCGRRPRKRPNSRVATGVWRGRDESYEQGRARVVRLLRVGQERQGKRGRVMPLIRQSRALGASRQLQGRLVNQDSKQFVSVENPQAYILAKVPACLEANK